MNIDTEKLKDLLVRENYVSEEDYTAAEVGAAKQKISVIDQLLAQNIVSKDLIGQAVAESYGMSYADLNSKSPSRDQVLKIPEDIAKKYRVVLFNEAESGVTLTTDTPGDESLKDALTKIFPNKQIEIAYSITEDINQSFQFYQKTLETRFSQIIKAKSRVAPELLQEIFGDAYRYQASDIHFEPQPEEVLVRFRVDGVLHEAGRIPREHYENILNRIKVQSGLRIDEHFAAQDGSLRYEDGDKTFDLRTSIVPTVEGEKIVLRVLAAYVQGFALGDIGFSAAHQKQIEEASKKPFGMILVTGPTGSGKTTTLYAVLRRLLRPEVNITTIEDPVEYKVMGINQIQVNQSTDLTFAKGLRSIVRQDPDIILVGEIRDTETAEIAVNAALTGHLLLSTFHANDAATAIPRLLDMDIEPFLLASTLEVVIAQRLVRKICDHCRYSVTTQQSDLEKLFKQASSYFPDREITLYAGKGCAACGDTGYNGRIAIFEFIAITPEMQDLILKQPSTREIWKLASAQGSRTLFDDGIDKVKSGATTVEELLRVVPAPDRA